MNRIRHPDPLAPPPRGECLSSIVDGECRSGEVEDACRCWQGDRELQGDWRLYHLIGDVLRSDDLSPAEHAHDAAFLTALRVRLAAEPVPLAPAPLAVPLPIARPAAAAASRRWSMPVAMAAGLAGVMVAGSAVVMLQPGAESPGTGWGAQVAVTPGASVRGAGVQPVSVLPVLAPEPAPTLAVEDGRLLRDPRLDAYIEAHRGALAPLPVAMPGAALRSVDVRTVAR